MERRDKFFKLRNAGTSSNHSDRIDQAIHKQLYKQSRDRAAKISSKRACFKSPDFDQGLGLDKCVQLLESGELLSEEIICVFNHHFTQLDPVTTLAVMDRINLMERINISLDTIVRIDESVNYAIAILELLDSLSSKDLPEAGQHAFSCIPSLVRLLARYHDGQRVAFLHKIFLIMGNLCVRNIGFRDELVRLNAVSTVLSLVQSPDISIVEVTITCWFLSVIIDHTVPIFLLQEATGMSKIALASQDEEACTEGCWLLCTLNSVKLHRNDFDIDKTLILEAVSLLSKWTNKVAEPLLFLVGSASKDQFELFDNATVASLFDTCFSMDVHIGSILKTAFSVACKLALGLESPSFVTCDFIVQRLDALISSEIYSVQIEIIHFVDFLLVSQHPSMKNRTHYFCGLVVQHMSYIFLEASDLEVLTIVLEMIYHELTTHTACDIRQLILNSSVGESVENLALIAKDPRIRSVSSKLADILFGEENDIEDSPVPLVVQPTVPRMGRGSSAVKPAWMS